MQAELGQLANDVGFHSITRYHSQITISGSICAALEDALVFRNLKDKLSVHPHDDRY